MKTLFNKMQAAEHLGISLSTLNRLKKGGKMPHHKIGDRIVFTEEDIEAFLDSCGVAASSPMSEREKLEAAKREGGASNENPA